MIQKKQIKDMDKIEVNVNESQIINKENSDKIHDLINRLEALKKRLKL